MRISLWNKFINTKKQCRLENCIWNLKLKFLSTFLFVIVMHCLKFTLVLLHVNIFTFPTLSIGSRSA